MRYAIWAVLALALVLVGVGIFVFAANGLAPAANASVITTPMDSGAGSSESSVTTEQPVDPAAMYDTTYGTDAEAEFTSFQSSKSDDHWCNTGKSAGSGY